MDTDVIVTPEEKIEKLEKRIDKLEDTVNNTRKSKVVFKPFLYRSWEDD